LLLAGVCTLPELEANQQLAPTTVQFLPYFTYPRLSYSIRRWHCFHTKKMF
jgi:hypothetical protein